LKHVTESKSLHRKSKVAVFTTGGTIVSNFNRAKGTITPVYSGKELLGFMPECDCIDLELHEFCNMPSPYLTPNDGFKLAKKVEDVLKDSTIDGAVVVQGTDTLEEIVYLFHLVLDVPKPVVFTGAIKSRNQLYFDGTGNLLGAIKLAACSDASERGVMAYFNQEIHSARYVVKTHTDSVSAFRSPECGPIGRVYNDRIIFYGKPEAERKYQIDQLDEKVVLIKAACGMDDLLIRASIDSGVSGMVIEGLGAGNLPPKTVKAVANAINRGIPVVMVSRCITGCPMGMYEYEGGGANLRDIGVIMGGSLNGQKARIKLMVLLTHNKNVEYIRQAFEE
jgi:L-asparaginase